MSDRTTSGQRERARPLSSARDAGAVRDSCQLARLASRGIQLLSRESGGVPNPEYKGSPEPPWRAKRQGSASLLAGEDGHRSQRCPSITYSDSQRISGADPCKAPVRRFSDQPNTEGSGV
jgi:hypothetical protein